MSIDIHFLDSKELKKYHSLLKVFEKQFIYPLKEDKDGFTINHGRDYSRFFDLQGKAYYVIALSCGNIVAVMSLIHKKNLFQGWGSGLYLCDLKVSKDFRGQKITNKIYWKAFFGLLHKRVIEKFPYTYFVAMQGENGDLATNRKSKSWLSIFKEFSFFYIFFVDKEKLGQNIGIREIECKQIDAIQLTASSETHIVDLKNIKDIVLESSGDTMPLLHLNCQVLWGADYLNYLFSAASKVPKDAQLCFAVDSKRVEVLSELTRLGIEPNASAKAYCPFWQKAQLSKKMVFIGTHEI